MLAVVSSIVSFLIILFVSINSLALEVMCGNQNDCHPSVAALTIQRNPQEVGYDKTTVDYCSGFLIAPNQILTNGHCVFGRFGASMSPTRKGQSCSSLKVSFPEVKVGGVVYHEETVSCVMLGDLPYYDPRVNEGLPDFAVLYIQPVSRPPIVVSKAGVVDKELNKSVAYNFIDVDVNTSQQRKVAVQRSENNCEVDMGNETKPFSSGLAPMIFYKNCRVIPGNSGSVLLNSRGEAVTLATAMNKMSRTKSFTGELFLDSGAATNLACIDTVTGSETNEEYLKACNLEAFYTEQGNFIKVMIDRMDKKIATEINPNNLIANTVKRNNQYGEMKYQKYFMYFKQDVSYQRDWAPQIECINRSKVLSRQMSSKADPGFKIDAPTYRASGAYSKDYRFVVTEAKIVPSVYFFKILSLSSDASERKDSGEYNERRKNQSRGDR